MVLKLDNGVNVVSMERISPPLPIKSPPPLPGMPGMMKGPPPMPGMHGMMRGPPQKMNKCVYI